MSDKYDEYFTGGMGAEAVKTLLMEMDLEEEIALIEQQMTETKSEAKIKKLYSFHGHTKEKIMFCLVLEFSL